MPKVIVLKKYPNRRLYDTENSRYVTLSQVADLIRKGRQVRVVDVKTENDVTALILTQIVMERAKSDNSVLPVSLLHLLIQFGDSGLGDFFDNYLEQALHSYMTHKKNMDEQFKACLELGMDFSSMAQKTLKDFTPFKPFFYGSDEEEK